MSDTKKSSISVTSTHADLYEVAIKAHQASGGAQVEVSEGTRKVKIGAMPSGINNLIPVLTTAIVDYLQDKNKPDDNSSDKEDKEDKN